MTDTLTTPKGTIEIRRLMAQSEKDCAEVKRLKKLYWDCNAVKHDYPDLVETESILLDLAMLVSAIQG